MYFKNLEQVLLFVADQPGFKGEILGDLLRVIAEGVFVDLGIEVYDPEIEPLQPLSLEHKAINTMAFNYKKQFERLEKEMEKIPDQTSQEFSRLGAEQSRINERAAVLLSWLNYSFTAVCIDNRDKLRPGDAVTPIKPLQMARIPANSGIRGDLLGDEKLQETQTMNWSLNSEFEV